MHRKLFYLVLSCLAINLIWSCASVGSPEGGPYDETPPKVIKSLPKNQSTNNKQKKINLFFDEYIRLENASEKIVVSPPQLEMPEISEEGKRITIELFDTLKENTTYTIDFSDAIVDNNEGNPMGQFTYSFSTGDKIDTMEVSGIVLNAADLEPIKGILVGLYQETEPDVFRKKPMLRVARTNGSGRFIIKGIAPGSYRIYALLDADGDFLFNQKSEQIAFDTTLVVTSSAPDTRQDTIWRDSTHIDSIVPVPYTHYYPDNLVLRAFKEDGQDLHLLKIERPLPTQFSVFFTAPSDTLPEINGINFDPQTALLLEKSAKNDTLTYWIQDSVTARLDTLKFTLKYLDTDTLGQLVYRTDTLELAPKVTQEKLDKQKEKEKEEWEKRNRKLRRKNKDSQTELTFPKEYFRAQLSTFGSMAPNQNIVFTFPKPLASMDSTKFQFQKKVDTLWVDEPYLFLPVEGKMREYCLYAAWKPNQEYKFTADTAAFMDIFGTESEKIESQVKIASLESFGSLFVHIASRDTGVVVELLNSSGNPVRAERAVNQRADFFFLTPGNYYIRAFIDRNGNNQWDTGNFDTQLQPEEMFYFPKMLPIKVRMEIEQDWDLRGISWDKQKPQEIIKQKPDQEKKIQNRNQEYYKKHQRN